MARARELSAQHRLTALMVFAWVAAMSYLTTCG